MKYEFNDEMLIPAVNAFYKMIAAVEPEDILQKHNGVDRVDGILLRTYIDDKFRESGFRILINCEQRERIEHSTTFTIPIVYEPFHVGITYIIGHVKMKLDEYGAFIVYIVDLEHERISNVYRLRTVNGHPHFSMLNDEADGFAI